MSEPNKIVAISPHGEIIVICDSYKQAGNYITFESEYDLSEVDIGEGRYISGES